MGILTKKEARKLHRPMTIDLREIQAKEYINSKKTIFTKILEKMIKYFGIPGIIWFVIVCLFGWGVLIPENVNATSQDAINRENARLSRLISCNERISLIKEYTIHNQDIGTRCATIRTLSKDYSPYSDIMKNINTQYLGENYWKVYYDIKRIRIKNNISTQTSIHSSGKKITYDMIGSNKKIPYAIFKGLERECRIQGARDQFHCIRTGLSIAWAECSWKDNHTPFGLQSKEKGYRRWVQSYNKYWYTAKDGFFFYGDWGVYGKSHYCTSEESSGSSHGCPNGRKNFDATWNSVYLK